MPAVDYSTSEIFEKSYKMLYIRDNKNRITMYGKDVPKTLNLNNNSKIIVVGAGFGWLIEEWELPACALDTSDYIQSNLDNAKIPIHNIDVSNPSNHQTILNLLNSLIADVAITENMLICCTDNEMLKLSASLHMISKKVVHFTQFNENQRNDTLGHNWKSIEEFQKLLPNDFFISFETGKLFYPVNHK